MNEAQPEDPPGTGRIYTIDVEGSDAAGNTIRQSVTVRVGLKPS